jgi:hypothetical protein
VKNVSRIKKPTRIDKTSFFAGFLSAVIVILFLMSGATGMAATRGVTVSLNSGDMAQIIRDRIIIQAKGDLPHVIEQAKAEIPSIVEKEMEDQFASDRMEIAGFVFTMPDELVEQLKTNMQQNVERATAKIMDGINTDALADQLGEDAYLLVQETMQNELNGQSFNVMVLNRIPVRVHVLME